MNLAPSSFRFSLLFSLGFLLLFSPARTLAQSAHWDPPGGTLPTGIISELSLIFENCEPSSDPTPPAVEGLMLAQRGSSQSVSIVNFSKTSSYIYNFAARLEKAKAVDVPSFVVDTDKGKITVPALHLEPGQASIGRAGLSVAEIAQSNFLFPAETVWEGEVFALTYRLDVLRRYYHQLASNPDWDPSPLVTEDWGKPELNESVSKNEKQVSILYRTRAYAPALGPIKFNSAQQLVNIRTGSSSGFGFFSAQPELQQLVVSSAQPLITVKPLPSPAPTAFNGAVGTFKLNSKIVPRDARVGEPITWTLELSGEGNWPAINALPARAIPKSFEVIQPQAKRVLSEGKLFEGTLSEDLVMIPSKAGIFTIPALTLSYFDPSAGVYKTLTTQETSLTIAPAASSTTGQSSNTGSSGAGQVRAEPGKGLINDQSPLPPEAQIPAPIPGETIGTKANALTPLTDSETLKLIVLPFCLIPPFWLILAFLKAIKNDPAAPRRAAYARLRRLLLGDPDKLQSSRTMLAAWQAELALCLGKPCATPALHLLAPALPAQHRPLFTSLWEQADALLYGSATSLPQNWLLRARTLTPHLKPPAFKLASVPRHLLPLLLVSLILIQSPLAAAQTAPADAQGDAAKSADKAYREGNYPEAIHLLSAEVAKNPLNWVARHNLGLAYLQRNQAGPAMAELATAFVQNPTNDLVRRNFRNACHEAGVSPLHLGPLTADAPLAALTRLNTIRTWQLLLSLGATLLVVGLVLRLLKAYGMRLPLHLPLSVLFLCSGLLVLGVSFTAVHQFGLTKEDNAAIVWQNSTLRSIPTEADATQKTAALPTGTLGLVDKSYFGWKHLQLENGEGGWVRSEDLVLFWH